MTGKRSLTYLLLLCPVLIFCGCANMVTPEGGPDDVEAPVAEYFLPENNSTHFTSSSVTIRFNEYIQLNNPASQVLISPPLTESPEYKLRGKTLTITFNSQLKDSTTYTINFGQSIKDITKGNILNNFTYVFSTGDMLDSLQVSGKITDLLTAAPSTSAYAVLYPNDGDSLFTTQAPYYFAKVDETGSFTIKNIRSGYYRLYAIEDQNFNYYFDLPNEKIAFLPAPIPVDSLVAPQKLKLFLEDKQKQNLVEAKSTAYGTTRFVFSQPTHDVTITYTGDNPDAGTYQKNKSGDTVFYFNTSLPLERHSFTISFDTIIITKEIELKLPPVDSVFIKSKNDYALNTPFIKGGGRADWDLNQEIIVSFVHPLDTSGFGEVTVRKDSTLEAVATLRVDSADTRKLYISYPWRESTDYDIHIPQNLTKDIFGLSNDSVTIRLKTKKETDYAKLTLNLSSLPDAGIIFQLLTFDLNIVEEKYLSPASFTDHKYSVAMDHLSPGIYKIKAVIDIDGNKKWTAGDLLLQKMPEPVYFFPVDQNLRANWESELEWDLNSRN